MYIEEHKDYGLGNFISCTPVIRYLYETTGEKVPVLFSKNYVKECYLNSPFIKHIDSPEGELYLSSSLRNKRNQMTDIEFIQRVKLNKTVNYNTFIDEVEPISGRYGVFINGAGSEADFYLEQKLVDRKTQELIRSLSNIDVVGIGSKEDSNRNIFSGSYGNIRECLRYLKGAEWVISNVTGLYHAAGAYKKRQLVLWKDCKYPRNKNINTLSTTSKKGEWSKDIINFLK